MRIPLFNWATDFSKTLLVFAFCGLSCPSSHGAETVDFRAFVQTEYRGRQDLHAWRHTADLITRAIREKFSLSADSVILENQPPESLVSLFGNGGGSKAKWKILYLGSHVHGSGKILFADGSKILPDEIARLVANKENPWKPDLVIVDTCHAATFSYMKRWRSVFPCSHLYASDTNQLAWEIDFEVKQPVHVEKTYPALYQLAYRVMPSGWDGTLSDLGFRLGKLMTAPPSAGPPLKFFRNLSGMPKESNVSRRFRQSNLIWENP